VRPCFERVAQPRSALAAAAPSPCGSPVSPQHGCTAISTRSPIISMGYEKAARGYQASRAIVAVVL
jgi:hypothetical protein